MLRYIFFRESTILLQIVFFFLPRVHIPIWGQEVRGRRTDTSLTGCFALGHGGERCGGSLPDVLTLCAADSLQTPSSFKYHSFFCIWDSQRSSCVLQQMQQFLLLLFVLQLKFCFLSFWYSSYFLVYLFFFFLSDQCWKHYQQSHHFIVPLSQTIFFWCQ